MDELVTCGRNGGFRHAIPGLGCVYKMIPVWDVYEQSFPQ